MPKERDSALTRILELLGLSEINSTLAQHANCETIGSASSPIPLNPTTASPVEKTDPPPSKELPENRYMDTMQSQSLSSLPATTYGDTRTIAAGVGRSPQESSSRSIMECWDWDIGLGTYITPNTSDIHCLFETVSPSGTLGTTLEEIPEPLSPEPSDNNSTFVEDTSDSEGIDSLTDELSDRVGTLRIGPGGQTHFCGPTSNFNLPNMPISDTFEAYRKAKHDVLQRLDRLGCNIEIPASLEEHLINLYFSWQNPFFHVVDRRIYEEAKVKWLDMKDTPFYSESLRNAM